MNRKISYKSLLTPMKKAENACDGTVILTSRNLNDSVELMKIETKQCF